MNKKNLMLTSVILVTNTFIVVAAAEKDGGSFPSASVRSPITGDYVLFSTPAARLAAESKAGCPPLLIGYPPHASDGEDIHTLNPLGMRVLGVDPVQPGQGAGNSDEFDVFASRLFGSVLQGVQLSPEERQLRARARQIDGVLEHGWKLAILGYLTEKLAQRRQSPRLQKYARIAQAAGLLSLLASWRGVGRTLARWSLKISK